MTAPAAAIDWPGLRAEYAGTGLLHEGLTVPDAVPVLGAGLAYLASPYSLRVVEGGRFLPYLSDMAADEAAGWSAALARGGVTAISPIVQAAPMIYHGIDPLDQPFWTRWCRPLLLAAQSVVIPPIRGWEVSLGVWHEATEALAACRRVVLLAPWPELSPATGDDA